MATDIFIVSYRKDARWLQFCLRSIQKYAKKFRHAIVVVPKDDEDLFRSVCHPFSFVKLVTIEPGEDGNCDQVIAKTSCDLFSDADFFLHMDSDCVFTEEATPLDYATDSKPDLWWEAYSNLAGGARDAIAWKGVTERALGFTCQVETMRRFPFVYPRWLYKVTREQIEKEHGVPFVDFVRTASKGYEGATHGYSEFNALGCMAYYVHPQFFSLKQAGKDVKPSKVKQFWSHSGLTPEEEQELRQITANWNLREIAPTPDAVQSAA